MADRFQYRRIIRGDELERWLQDTFRLMNTVNATAWKAYPARTVRLITRQHEQQNADGTIETLSGFIYDTGARFFQDTAGGRMEPVTTKVQVLDEAEFNGVDFGTLWLPEHERN